MNKMLKEMAEWKNSENGKNFFRNVALKRKLKEDRYERFEWYLLCHDFNKLMHRLILEHDEKWTEMCSAKGCEVYPNNKLQLVIDYIFHKIEPINVPELNNGFPNQVWFFKGFYFQLTHGQGSIIDIYNGEDYKHLLQV